MPLGAIRRRRRDPRRPVEIINSPLSEAGVLGFEYGYSLDCPDGLVLWEAQFGDFVNVAQVIIDQFIVSAEDKWRRLSGLVLLLPHGFEGQGPEHSSARLERFLRLGAEDNIQVVEPTTPAQYFHVLRRQVLRRWRKPLVVMTPKSLLRQPECVSPLEDLTRGRYRRVIADPEFAADPKGAPPGRVLLCCGKIYYELLEARNQRQPTLPSCGSNSSSAAAIAVEKGPGTVRRRHARHLGAGRAAKHGGLVFFENAVRRAAVRAVPVHGSRPAGVGQAGDWFGQLPPLGAEGADRPRVW